MKNNKKKREKRRQKETLDVGKNKINMQINRLNCGKTNIKNKYVRGLKLVR